MHATGTVNTMTVADQGFHGASAYFSEPAKTLDPDLFTGNLLRADVKDYILHHMASFLDAERVSTGPWLHAWLAGSGVSYQWHASRSQPGTPGDLDVLLGIDPVMFAQANPGISLTSRNDLAALLNSQMKKYLWPLTAAAKLGTATYEVTYYWNPEVSDDIRVIHPYAAWSLDNDRWDVPPDPAPAADGFPPEWQDAAWRNDRLALDAYSRWSQDLADVLTFPAHNPAAVRARVGLQRTTAELRQIWETLHDGRRYAFTGGGLGWGDWHNYRWQHAKAAGVIDRLREVIGWDDQRRAAEDTRLYGAPIEPAELALRRAASAYRWETR